jgi:UDP-N-acetylglucosamine--N-acetylmuramyl-(pentapeptide) pyrophosphoryl-undecaprenol N-acetylglucosamine transferase
VPARAAATALAGVAVVRCLVWMLRSRPDLVIGAGGYASGPAMLAGLVLGVKTMVMEQNHFPGATNRFLAPRVDAVCVPSEAAMRRLAGRRAITGNPVRAAFTKIGPPPDGPELSLLIFGGSRGARSINQAAVEALSRFAAMTSPPRIVHQTGPEDESPAAAAYREHPGIRSEVRAFLDDMPDRLADADLAVCRAGAMTLAELAAAGRPAVLIPYPYAADDHQRLNAEAVRDAGAAVVILDRDLSGSTLADAVESLARDRGRRLRMGEAARALARPNAAARIADIAEAVVQGAPIGSNGGVDVP